MKFSKPPLTPPCQGENANSSPDKGRLGGVYLYIPYKRELKEYARQNRKNPTQAEQKMWSILQIEQFAKYKFTRQKPLDTFIADFYCAQLLLVIEIDGDTHAQQEEYDALRSDILKARYRIKVIRYTNLDVVQNIDGVYEDIYKQIRNLDKRPQQHGS
ncbi:DUF559 domain-containing protein [Patescibacteria group bacterium]|nr:DUF559 domain-containing protein [Patescibacteria group bacterium]